MENKWSFKNQKLREILFLQDFGQNPSKFAFLGVKGHIGIDVNWGNLDAVYSFTDGEVCYISDYGDVIIKDDKFEYTYSHLNDWKRFKIGDKIKAGQYIGLQDSNGKSVQNGDWTHLHFGMRELGEETPKVWNFGNKIKNVNNGYDGYINPAPYCQQVIKRVAEAIEKFENMPLEYNNPGALRWSPFQSGIKNGFAVFSDYQTGYQALIHQLTIAAAGKSQYYQPYWRIDDFFKIYAPVNDKNNPTQYSKFVIDYCGFRGNEQISDWLLSELEWVKKYNTVSKDYWIENILIRTFNKLWGLVFKGR